MEIHKHPMFKPGVALDLTQDFDWKLLQSSSTIANMQTKPLCFLQLRSALVARTSRFVYVLDCCCRCFFLVILLSPRQGSLVEEANVIARRPQPCTFIIWMSKVMHPECGSIHLSWWAESLKIVIGFIGSIYPRSQNTLKARCHSHSYFCW